MVAGLAVVVIAAIGWIDYLTGPDLSFALFYLVPIVACAWWSGQRATWAAGILASLSWFAADYALRSAAHFHVSLWNALTRLVIFLALGTLLTRLQHQRLEMTALNERLRSNLEREALLARTDPVTGLANSRAFLESLDRRLAEGQGAAHSLSIAYLDLDNFKEVNDAYGHAAGDEVLRRMGELLAREMRADDLAARVGGDEFAVVVSDITSAELRSIAARLLARVSELAGDFPNAPLGVSIGAAHFERFPPDAETALHRADTAMYTAKARGKGTLVVETAALAPPQGESTPGWRNRQTQGT